MCKTIRTPLKTPVSATVLTAACAAQTLDYGFYAALRGHGEAVEADNEDALGSYTGWRDAYSRSGFRTSQNLNENVTAYGQFELPLEISNQAVQDPWIRKKTSALARSTSRLPTATWHWARCGCPITTRSPTPANMFSSYCGGFVTYTMFRKGDTMACYTPSFAGFSASAAYRDANGAADKSGNPDDRWTATLGYTVGDPTLVGGLQDTRWSRRELFRL